MRNVLSALGLFLTCGAAHAAEFSTGPDLPDGCWGMVSGPILAGDADRFAAFKAQRDRGAVYTGKDYLCLDSPGGSVAEALNFIDAGVGNTMIPANARCESACALIFMAGTWYLEGGIGNVSDRWMHVSARLGFHAPSLVVPDQQYSQDSVTRAYDLSLATIAEILRRGRELALPQSLLVEMLDTPPSEMFYIDTVDKAARWGIEVFGVDAPVQVSPQMAMNACLNASAEAHETGTDETATLSPFTFRNSYSVNRDYGAISPTVVFGAGDAGQRDCSFDYRPDDDFRVSLDGRHFRGEGVNGRVTPLHFHAPGTPLNYVAGGGTPRAYAPERAYATVCSVYKGDTLLDRQDCRVEETYALDDTSLMPTVTQTFNWPSGARTIITSMDGAYIDARINGSATNYADLADAGDGARCMVNTGSGNTFCYTAVPFEGLR